MLKSTVAFLAASLVVLQAGAVEITVVANTKKIGDKKPYVLEFDGSTDISASMVEKMINCYGAFNDDNKDALLNVFEVSDISEMKSNLKMMKSDSTLKGNITLQRQNQFQSFIEGALKECLSN